MWIAHSRMLYWFALVSHSFNLSSSVEECTSFAGGNMQGYYDPSKSVNRSLVFRRSTYGPNHVYSVSKVYILWPRNNQKFNCGPQPNLSKRKLIPFHVSTATSRSRHASNRCSLIGVCNERRILPCTVTLHQRSVLLNGIDPTDLRDQLA